MHRAEGSGARGGAAPFSAAVRGSGQGLVLCLGTSPQQEGGCSAAGRTEGAALQAQGRAASPRDGCLRPAELGAAPGSLKSPMSHRDVCSPAAGAHPDTTLLMGSHGRERGLCERRCPAARTPQQLTASCASPHCLLGTLICCLFEDPSVGCTCVCVTDQKSLLMEARNESKLKKKSDRKKNLG